MSCSAFQGLLTVNILQNQSDLKSSIVSSIISRFVDARLCVSANLKFEVLQRFTSENRNYFSTMKLLILLFVTFAVAAEDELSKCKCQKGYYPQKDESGVVSCYGSILKTNEKSILPCNVLVKPSCICKDDATSIVQDESGTWCSKVSEGKEDKRWPCENKEDWAAFYSAHPEEKP